MQAVVTVVTPSATVEVPPTPPAGRSDSGVPFRRHAYESATARMFHDFRLREHRLLSARFGRG